jgi:hypothetical protein
MAFSALQEQALTCAYLSLTSVFKNERLCGHTSFLLLTTVALHMIRPGITK